jgi:hypothetical protein
LQGDGRLLRYDRPNTLPWSPKRVHMAYSNDGGVNWSASVPVFGGEADWESVHIGSGAVPFIHRQPDGSRVLASFYRGVCLRQGAPAGVYQTGLACLDPVDPRRLLGRLATPALSVWSREKFLAERRTACNMTEGGFTARHGAFVVESVLTTSGHARLDDEQWLFNGLNDFCIELAVLDPLDSLLTSPSYRNFA